MELTQHHIISYLQQVPKAELHVHLEGAIRPETVITLAQRNKVTLPVTTVEEARQWFIYRDFPHFVEIFSTIARISTLYGPFNFSLDVIDDILLNGIRHSFMSTEEKCTMEEKFRTQMKSLRPNEY